MRYFTILILACALTGATASLAQTAAPIPATFYPYGNDLGVVTLNDLATDGQIITLKGVQVWPELSDKPKVDITATPAQIHKMEVINRVVAKQIELQRVGTPNAEITPQLVAMMNADKLVAKAFQRSDNNFGYVWTDAPDTEVFVVVDTANRVSKQDILDSQFRILSMYIETGCIIIVTSSVRQAIPPSPIDPEQQTKARLEIDAARKCSWQGGILHEDVVRSFERPMAIPNPREE
ncbi:MAG: hypothetical protein WC693_02785 [Patescibacteria group bacterium]|jgi:hypothetical protein